jgi:hypothetical protein
MDLYVYYRVQGGNADTLHPRIMAMQTSLAQRFTLATALKRRTEASNGTQTWMEIYMALAADILEAFTVELELAAAQIELSGLIQGSRHTERFLDISPCA